MGSWKTLAIAAMALVGNQAVSAENHNPFKAAVMFTSAVFAVIISGATAATSSILSLFKSAKSVALVFIGSGEEIRGAEFEQAPRYYRSTYSSPLMPDMQFAQSITVSYRYKG